MKDKNISFRVKNKIVGTCTLCYLSNDEVYIDNFEIFPEFRKNGYGSKFLDKLITNYGANALDVGSDNTIAIDLYTKFGFSIIKTYNKGKILHMKRI